MSLLGAMTLLSTMTVTESLLYSEKKVENSIKY